MSKYKISENKAVDLLKEWGEELEVDIDSDQFIGKDGVIETLKISVRRENLSFDPATRKFTYILFFPIEKKDGSEKISRIEIESTTMERKRVVQNIRESQKIDQAIAMIAESTGLEVGFAGRLKDKDVSRINAVVMGFLV